MQGFLSLSRIVLHMYLITEEIYSPIRSIEFLYVTSIYAETTFFPRFISELYFIVENLTNIISSRSLEVYDFAYVIDMKIRRDKCILHPLVIQNINGTKVLRLLLSSLFSMIMYNRRNANIDI